MVNMPMSINLIFQDWETFLYINTLQLYLAHTRVKFATLPKSPPQWGLIPSEPSASAERGTGRLSAAQLGGLVFVDPGGRLRTIHQ